MEHCRCFDNPMESNCGVWDDNTSACPCVELGLAGQLPP